MVSEPTSRADRRRALVDEVDLPADAAHIVVVKNTVRAPAPEGYPGEDTLVYEPGDELPFEHGKRAFRGHASLLAVLDADGEVLAGAEVESRKGPMFFTPDAPERLQQPPDVDGAIDRWRAGEGFDPSEHAAAEER